MAKTWKVHASKVGGDAVGCDECHFGTQVIEDPPRNPAKLSALLADGWSGCPYSLTLSRPCPACAEGSQPCKACGGVGGSEECGDCEACMGSGKVLP